MAFSLVDLLLASLLALLFENISSISLLTNVFGEGEWFELLNSSTIWFTRVWLFVLSYIVFKTTFFPEQNVVAVGIMESSRRDLVTILKIFGCIAGLIIIF